MNFKQVDRKVLYEITIIIPSSSGFCFVVRLSVGLSEFSIIPKVFLKFYVDGKRRRSNSYSDTNKNPEFMEMPPSGGPCCISSYYYLSLYAY